MTREEGQLCGRGTVQYSIHGPVEDLEYSITNREIQIMIYTVSVGLQHPHRAEIDHEIFGT